MKTGKLVVFTGPGKPLEIHSKKIRSLRPQEILIKNLFTTICSSDLHTYCGLREEACPTVLGHEIVGEILELGTGHSGLDYAGKKIMRGDIITWSIFSSDPRSSNALNGIPQKGESLFKYGHGLINGKDAFHGGLAEYCILKPETGVLKLPPTLPLPIAATINCAIATVAGGLRMAGNIKNKNVLIFGMGLLGITCATMCKDAGASWIGAADISQKRLDDAIAFAADEAIHLRGDMGRVLQKIRAKFPGKGVDIVFDMSGSPDAMEWGLDTLAIGGTAIWIGAVLKTRKLQVDAEKIIRNLITIRGLHNYNFEDFVYALDFISRNWKQYPFERVVEKEFDLSNAQEAFEYAIKHKPLRVGIRI